MYSWIAGSLLALLSTSVIALALFGLRSGAGHNEVEVLIASPSSEVWRYLHDPEQVKKWVGGLVAIEPLNGTELVVGLRDRLIVEMGSSRMELLSEVTALDPGKRLAQRVVSGPGASIAFQELATFTLEDVGDGTRFRAVGVSRYLGIGRLLEPIITAAAQKKLREDLARLKAVVESSQPLPIASAIREVSAVR